MKEWLQVIISLLVIFLIVRSFVKVTVLIDLSASMVSFYKDGTLSQYCTQLFEKIRIFSQRSVRLVFFNCKILDESQITNTYDLGLKMNYIQKHKEAFTYGLEKKHLFELVKEYKNKKLFNIVLLVNDYPDKNQPTKVTVCFVGNNIESLKAY